MKYAEFDWQKCEGERRPEIVEWMRKHANTKTTELEFVTFHKSLRQSDTGGDKARRYSNSRLRGQYRRLKEKYGFFV